LINSTAHLSSLVNPQLVRWLNNWKNDDAEKIGGSNRSFDCKYRRNGKEAYRYQGACPVPKSIMADGTWDDPEDGYES
jgi:hypothetical protein